MPKQHPSGIRAPLAHEDTDCSQNYELESQTATTIALRLPEILECIFSHFFEEHWPNTVRELAHLYKAARVNRVFGCEALRYLNMVAPPRSCWDVVPAERRRYRSKSMKAFYFREALGWSSIGSLAELSLSRFPALIEFVLTIPPCDDVEIGNDIGLSFFGPLLKRVTLSCNDETNALYEPLSKALSKHGHQLEKFSLTLSRDRLPLPFPDLHWVIESMHSLVELSLRYVLLVDDVGPALHCFSRMPKLQKLDFNMPGHLGPVVIQKGNDCFPSLREITIYGPFHVLSVLQPLLGRSLTRCFLGVSIRDVAQIGELITSVVPKSSTLRYLSMQFGFAQLGVHPEGRPIKISGRDLTWIAKTCPNLLYLQMEKLGPKECGWIEVIEFGTEEITNFAALLPCLLGLRIMAEKGSWPSAEEVVKIGTHMTQLQVFCVRKRLNLDKLPMYKIPVFGCLRWMECGSPFWESGTSSVEDEQLTLLLSFQFPKLEVLGLFDLDDSRTEYRSTCGLAHMWQLLKSNKCLV